MQKMVNIMFDWCSTAFWDEDGNREWDFLPIDDNIIKQLKLLADEFNSMDPYDMKPSDYSKSRKIQKELLEIGKQIATILPDWQVYVDDVLIQ